VGYRYVPWALVVRGRGVFVVRGWSIVSADARCVDGGCCGCVVVVERALAVRCRRDGRDGGVGRSPPLSLSCVCFVVVRRSRCLSVGESDEVGWDGLTHGQRTTTNEFVVRRSVATCCHVAEIRRSVGGSGEVGWEDSRMDNK
jgi:hypothetical protein